MLVDSRPVWGIHRGTPVTDTFCDARGHPRLLRLLARFALSHRPPTGSCAASCVEHDGEHRGRLDLKHGGLLPIVDLARWAGMVAGVTSASTAERLRAAGAAGSLARATRERCRRRTSCSPSFASSTRSSSSRRVWSRDDHLDPSELSALTRSHLKEAFRAVASVQKSLAAELDLGVR